MGGDPSRDYCGGSILEEGPEIGIRPLQELMVASLYGRLDPIRHILVVDDKVGGRIALVSPDSCAELGSAHRLSSWDSTGGGDPPVRIAARDLPGDSPGALAEGWVRWVARGSITPQGVRQPT